MIKINIDEDLLKRDYKHKHYAQVIDVEGKSNLYLIHPLQDSLHDYDLSYQVMTYAFQGSKTSEQIQRIAAQPCNTYKQREKRKKLVDRLYDDQIAYFNEIEQGKDCFPGDYEITVRHGKSPRIDLEIPLYDRILEKSHESRNRFEIDHVTIKNVDVSQNKPLHISKINCRFTDFGSMLKRKKSNKAAEALDCIGFTYNKNGKLRSFFDRNIEFHFNDKKEITKFSMKKHETRSSPESSFKLSIEQLVKIGKQTENLYDIGTEARDRLIKELSVNVVSKPYTLDS